MSVLFHNMGNSCGTMRCLTILSPNPQTIEEGRETANTSESSTCDELRGKKKKLDDVFIPRQLSVSN